ncbi:MAG: hypothetical protein ACOZQL_26405 [Myxococcota bacterium]
MTLETDDLAEGDRARQRGEFSAARAAYLRAADRLEAEGALVKALVVLRVALGLELLDDTVPARMAALCARLGLPDELHDWAAYAAQIRPVRGSWPAPHAVAELAEVRWLQTGRGEVIYAETALARVVGVGGPHWVVERMQGWQSLPDRLVVALTEPFLDDDDDVRILGFPDTRTVYAVSSLGAFHRATPAECLTFGAACVERHDARAALAFVQQLVSRDETREAALQVVEQAFRCLGRDDKADVVKAQLAQLRQR